MGKIDDVSRSPNFQRRRYRRFRLRYPVLVEFSSGDLVCKIQTVSRNASIGGLLLESPSVLPKAQSIAFTLAVESSSMVRPIKFLGEGRVVRVEPRPGSGFDIAVECTHPMTQIEHYLVGSAD